MTELFHLSATTDCFRVSPDLVDFYQAPVSNSESPSSASYQGPSLPSLRPRANLTKIACESCRKRKAKASDRDQHVPKQKHDEIQKKANTYEQLYHLLTCLSEREAQGILHRLREGADVATTTRQVKDGDLPLQPAWALETRLHYEFPYSTSMPAALLSPDNPYLGSPVFEITSHALPQSAEQTEAWASQCETIYMTSYNVAELMDPHIPNIQKDIFLQAMRDGDTRFCSPLLVNAVLAKACVLDDWYNALPEPIKPHKAVLPCQLIMHMEYCVLLFKIAQMVPKEAKSRLSTGAKAVNNNTRPSKAVAYALRCLETILRLYYLRHSFEYSDTYLTYFLSILANMTIENINSGSVSPDDVEKLKILRATLILAIKGLYDQGQHVYVSSAMCRLMRDRMTNEDMNGLRRHTTWKDDQPLAPHYVRSTFPVTIVMLDEDWQLETVENLAKKYDQLALEANESESSMAITPDRGSEQAG
ncbi:hypothetical protein MRS44_013774 [Fusarium solani]|uniref:uncharacterized protein n=1 Tax=Fusarium solani TaxID=169388 RepID=UPI0032C40A0C|nr:hypothetical protein MRS44_013774 [Fusarium solani]